MWSGKHTSPDVPVGKIQTPWDTTVRTTPRTIVTTENVYCLTSCCYYLKWFSILLQRPQTKYNLHLQPLEKQVPHPCKYFMFSKKGSFNTSLGSIRGLTFCHISLVCFHTYKPMLYREKFNIGLNRYHLYTFSTIYVSSFN